MRNGLDFSATKFAHVQGCVALAIDERVVDNSLVRKNIDVHRVLPGDQNK